MARPAQSSSRSRCGTSAPNSSIAFPTERECGKRSWIRATRYRMSIAPTTAGRGRARRSMTRPQAAYDARRRADVVVVGGGASGLSAAAALKTKGIDVVVLEEDARIGGTWARRYDRLHLHTVRGFSGLAHYGIPRRFPPYLSRDQFVEYLTEYAEHFRLQVVTASPVGRISRDAAANEWRITTVT